MKTDKSLRVTYEGRKVGTLAMTQDWRVAFEYDDEWLRNGFSISPFSLPLQGQVFLPVKNHFQGLFGVFADSLPDAWGNLLLDRLLRRNGLDPDGLNVLDRLAIVGQSGMGALCYEPEYRLSAGEARLDLDELAEQCRKVLQTEYAENLDELYRLGGTSGGARPKILTKIDGEDWMIKFASHVDGPDVGKMEYEYAVCAKECGIVMPEVRLFPSKVCAGYFGTKRFDRAAAKDGEEKRIHMLTAAALLELDARQPSLDYLGLHKLTRILTRGRTEDVENMFRRMCFNVFAHNRDDHSKNFAFLYDADADVWRLSPAYDLTYSSTYYGEHTTAVNGEGRRPGRTHLLAVGQDAGIRRSRCEELLDEVERCVEEKLSGYPLSLHQKI